MPAGRPTLGRWLPTWQHELPYCRWPLSCCGLWVLASCAPCLHTARAHSLLYICLWSTWDCGVCAALKIGRPTSRGGAWGGAAALPAWRARHCMGFRPSTLNPRFEYFQRHFRCSIRPEAAPKHPRALQCPQPTGHCRQQVPLARAHPTYVCAPAPLFWPPARLLLAHMSPKAAWLLLLVAASGLGAAAWVLPLPLSSTAATRR